MATVKPIVRLGDWEIFPDTCTLAVGQKKIKITPRSMDVLMHLAENPGEVVSARDLLDKFWSGSVTSDHAVHKVIAELRGALGDSAQQPDFIKTVPKRGYTLLQAATASTSPDLATAQSYNPVSSKRPWSLITLVTILGLLAVLAWPELDLALNSDREEPRLAVLPLVNTVNTNADEQALVDGLSHSLIAGLTSLNQLSVIVPAGAIPFESFDLQKIGQRLNASHVLHGNVLYAGDKARVTVSLTRVEDGIVNYSEQFDLDGRDIFQIHDDIVTNVVTSLNIHLNQGQRSRMLDWGTGNAVAYEQFLQGEFYNNQFNPPDFELAIKHHLAAVEEDPEFINAYLGVVTAANNYAVYATAEKIKILTELIGVMHRAVARIDPQSDALDSIRAVQLRVSGNDYRLQESGLRTEILSGTAPEFALAHYALFLIGARMYDEAQQFLNIASQVDPFEISPDEIWDYRVSVDVPENIIIRRKLQLQERPNHIGILGIIARNLYLTGAIEEAKFYAEKQESLDPLGLSSQLTAVFISTLAGELRVGSPALELEYEKGPNYNFNNGAISFMLGDIEKGIELWRSLPAVHKRRLINNVNSLEPYFADGVIQTPAYQQLLEELDFGMSWQRTLMEGVMAMEARTGVKLSAAAARAYENNELMHKNNLWSSQQWAQFELYKRQHRTIYEDSTRP